MAGWLNNWDYTAFRAAYNEALTRDLPAFIQPDRLTPDTRAAYLCGDYAAVHRAAAARQRATLAALADTQQAWWKKPAVWFFEGIPTTTEHSAYRNLYQRSRGRKPSSELTVTRLSRPPERRPARHEKWCFSCKQYHHVTQFAAREDAADGLQSYCLRCSGEYVRLWRARKRQKVKNAA